MILETLRLSVHSCVSSRLFLFSVGHCRTVLFSFSFFRPFVGVAFLSLLDVFNSNCLDLDHLQCILLVQIDSVLYSLSLFLCVCLLQHSNILLFQHRAPFFWTVRKTRAGFEPAVLCSAGGGGSTHSCISWCNNSFLSSSPINELDCFTTLAAREKSPSNMTSQSSAPRLSPLYRIPPFHYIHVLDQNTSLARLEIGPKTFFRQDNETITVGPEKMITLPPRHYCIVENPALVNEAGQVKLSHANIQIRLETDYKEPFPLYPGEVLKQVHRRSSVVRCSYSICF